MHATAAYREFTQLFHDRITNTQAQRKQHHEAVAAQQQRAAQLLKPLLQAAEHVFNEHPVEYHDDYATPYTANISFYSSSDHKTLYHQWAMCASRTLVLIEIAGASLRVTFDRAIANSHDQDVELPIEDFSANHVRHIADKIARLVTPHLASM